MGSFSKMALLPGRNFLLVTIYCTAAWCLQLPTEHGMTQSLAEGPPSFVEPTCNTTVKFSNVSWAAGAASLTAGLLKFGCQGSVRQLHWHPYADEWAYVVKGSFVVTITGPQDDPWPQSVSVAPEGSVWFFPKGWWHVILCQTDECELVLAFNNKAFIGKDDLDFAQAMLTLPAHIAAATLGVPEEEFHSRILPRLTQNDFSNHNAISNSPKGSCDSLSQTCPLPGPLTTFQPTVETWEDRAAVRRFEGVMPNRCNPKFGVTVYDIKAANFPFLEGVMQQRRARRNPDVGMSGQKMVLEPGAARPPLWITNANAVLYVVDGPVDVLVYGGPTEDTKKEVYNVTLVKAGIVYIPITSMYLIQNPSCHKNATVTLIFDHPEWEEQEMTKLTKFPAYALAASLNLDYTPKFG